MDINNHWKTIVDTLREGLIVVDSGGDIIAVNPAAERITGYSSDELLGQSCRILNCTGCKIYNKGRGELWCSLFAKSKARDKKCLIDNKAQRSVHIMKSASVLRDEDGEIIGAIETLTDISENVRQEDEIISLRKACHLNDGYHGILGKSVHMQRLFELIDNVAQSKAPVMIQGESGTGKELVARAIHEVGERRDNPYIQVSCAALNENLLESELFGHVKGAFTGADRTRIGRFEAAHDGTIFLDEIGDIPLSTQTKLLRVLEENKIERVGDHKPIPVNVRIITATNKNLEDQISKGLFREDLFFRINVFPLYCPSLSERKEDIPVIVRDFISQYALHDGKKIIGITSEAMEKLLDYSWPGNVRELRNAIEYAFILCNDKEIGLQHLPPKITKAGENFGTSTQKDSTFSQERQKLIDILRQADGNQSEAARILGVSRVTIWKRIKKYGIDLNSDSNRTGTE